RGRILLLPISAPPKTSYFNSRFRVALLYRLARRRREIPVRTPQLPTAVWPVMSCSILAFHVERHSRSGTQRLKILARTLKSLTLARHMISCSILLSRAEQLLSLGRQ